MKKKLELINLGLILIVLLVFSLRIFNIENAILNLLGLIAISSFIVIYIYRNRKNLNDELYRIKIMKKTDLVLWILGIIAMSLLLYGIFKLFF